MAAVGTLDGADDRKIDGCCTISGTSFGRLGCRTSEEAAAIGTFDGADDRKIDGCCTIGEAYLLDIGVRMRSVATLGVVNWRAPSVYAWGRYRWYPV